MRRASILIAVLTILFAANGLFCARKKPPVLSGKNILIVIAPGNFRDEELFITRDYLAKAGANILIASTTTTTIEGMRGKKVKPDALISTLHSGDFDAVIFIGGVGARKLWNNTNAQRLAKEAVQEKKVLGAICLAPMILAKAGLLKGKRATIFPSAGKRFVSLEVDYIDNKDVVVSGRIVTANGPKAADEFAQTLGWMLAPPKTKAAVE